MKKEFIEATEAALKQYLSLLDYFIGDLPETIKAMPGDIVERMYIKCLPPEDFVKEFRRLSSLEYQQRAKALAEATEPAAPELKANSMTVVEKVKAALERKLTPEQWHGLKNWAAGNTPYDFQTHGKLKDWLKVMVPRWGDGERTAKVAQLLGVKE